MILSKEMLKAIDLDRLNHLGLMADIVNGCISSDEGITTIVPEGRISDSPQIWAIDIDNGDIQSYLYESRYEYEQDLKTIQSALI